MTLHGPLAILARLIAYPTVAGQPNSELVAEVADRLARIGAAVTILPAHRPDARNLHALLGPSDAPGGLLLAAHSDVVAVDGQPWRHDPFALHIEHGRAYGRGTADMKGFLASALTAMTDVDRRRLRRPLHIALSSDEELGCRGVRPLLDTLAGLPVPPAAAVVGEPTMLRVADRHKGKAATRVHVRGRAVHSSLAPAGVNAVAFASRLITHLLELERELAAEAQDPAYTVPHPTIGIGPICGGVSVNIVPDHCRVDIEVRALPEHDPEQLLARVRAEAATLEAAMREIHPDAAIEFEPLSSYPGLRPALNRAFARTVAELAGDAAVVAVDFGTEAGLYQQKLGIPVVVCGPGDMAQAHQTDEFIPVEQLTRGRQFVLGLAQRLYRDPPGDRP
jgi:acetylornithine deacetylase